MTLPSTTACFAGVISLCAALGAQSPSSGAPLTYTVAGATVRIDTTDGSATVSRTDGERPLQPVDHRIGTRFGSFDPLAGEPAMAPDLLSNGAARLHLLQFETQLLEEYRTALQGLGVEVHQYVPHQAMVVRMDPSQRQLVESAPFVRWVGPLHPWYRLERDLRQTVSNANPEERIRLNILKVDWTTDTAALTTAVAGLGGEILVEDPQSMRMQVEVPATALAVLVQRDDVLWIDRWTPIEEDVDRARSQSGADYVEAVGGFTGKRLRGWNTEGIRATHVEFAATAHRGAPIALGNGSSSSHGTSVNGIIYNIGVNPIYRGYLPDAQNIYTNNSGFSRISATQQATDPNDIFRAMFSTASWGGGRTMDYTSASVEMDDAVFRFDIPHTQSQSNAGNTAEPRDSRPQAWGKNPISIGGVRHYGTLNPFDDSWANGGSTGPAMDNRIKPDLCAYYDSTGSASSSSDTAYTDSFGGTSGATPIVNGNLGLAIEMFTDGLFGHEAVAPGAPDRFDVKPHFTTSKAMLINSAKPYLFTQAGRFQQGWGFPDLVSLYLNRGRTLVLDEEDVLQPNTSREYGFMVTGGNGAFKATLTWNDPPGTAFASEAIVNDLDLTLISPSGVVWRGNHGLRNNLYSQPGGTRDSVNTVENVFVQIPEPGLWRVRIDGTAINQDSHLETSALDADFALVVSGQSVEPSRGALDLQIINPGPGDLQVSLGNLPAQWQSGFTFFSLNTARRAGSGYWLGIEADGFTQLSLGFAPSAGNVFAFTNTAGAVYPNTNFQFDAGLALLLQGATVDAVAVVFNGGRPIAGSNSVRFTIN